MLEGLVSLLFAGTGSLDFERVLRFVGGSLGQVRAADGSE
jgi:hypothetical protein